MIAQYSTPISIAYAFPWLCAASMFTTWIWLAFVTKRTSPSTSTSTSYKRKQLLFGGKSLRRKFFSVFRYFSDEKSFLVVENLLRNTRKVHYYFFIRSTTDFNNIFNTFHERHTVDQTKNPIGLWYFIQL